MNKTNAFDVAPPPLASGAIFPRLRSSRPAAALVSLLVVAAVFAQPLYRLAVFAFASELYSYIVLIPCLGAYFAWRKWSGLSFDAPPDFATGTLLLVGSGLTLAAYSSARLPEDQLALTTTSFLLAATGVMAVFLGRAFLRALVFPVGLLVFMIPVPSGAMAIIEAFMQHGSAAVAKALFTLCGTAVFYQDLNFQIPGINLRVAPECSGIHSTLALTIVSVVSGYFLLRSPAKRVLLVAFIVPLALLRNGIRIFTVGELCVHYGPQMIESYVHRHGGPIFFAASLVPFFLLVFLLQQREAAVGPFRHPGVH